MADFPTLAEIAVKHRWIWTNDGEAGCNCNWSHGVAMTRERWAEHVQAEWVKARTIETVEQLDALPLNTVVVDAAGIPRTSRAGNSHMRGGWTAGGCIPISSRELADGRPMVVVWHPERDR